MAGKRRSRSGSTGDGATTTRSASKKKGDAMTKSQKKTKRAETETPPSREKAHHQSSTNEQMDDECSTTAVHMNNTDGEYDVMGQVLKFLELTNSSSRGGTFGGGGQSKSSNVCGDAYAKLLAGNAGVSSSQDDKEEREGRLRSTIKGLVDYLSPFADESSAVKFGGSTNVSSSMISKADIAKLLLPWAVKSVLRRASSSSAVVSSQDVVQTSQDWKTMEACLGIIMPASAAGASIDASILSTVFNQSNLNKLVPLAAKVALDASIASEGESAVLEQARSAASCFRAMVLVYRPTFDATCNDLLVLVDGLLAKLQEREWCKNDLLEEGEGLPDSSFRFDFQAAVVNSVVGLIWKLQQSGAANPKKIFALLASPSTLSALGRFYSTSTRYMKDCGDELPSTQELVKHILWRGLFHASHHVEGFRSMNLDNGSLINNTEPNPSLERKKSEDKKKRKVTCYQESMFASIRTALMDAGADAVGVAAIVPLLIEGFVHETRKWLTDRERDTRSGGIGGGGWARKPSADANVTALQFKLWCVLLEPMVSRVKDNNKEDKCSIPSNVRLAVLRSIQVSLSVLLKYDLYLPSYPDPEQRNFTYLQTLSDTMFLCAELSLDSGDDDDGALEISSQQDLCEILLSLQSLLQTNHHVLHANLQRLLLIAASCLPKISGESGRSGTEIARQQQLGGDLICAAVVTYSRLRQLEHLFAALLMQGRGQSEPSEAFLIFERIIQDIRNANEISRATLSCPQGQVRPIWSLFDESISKIAKATGNDESGETESLRYVVSVFVLFLRSIRIDTFSAAEIKSLCESSVRTSITALVSEGNFNGSDNGDFAQIGLTGISSRAEHGISLCGWLVDVHTRCSFWLDLSFDDVAGSSLLTGGSPQSGAMLQLLLTAANSQPKTGEQSFSENPPLQAALQHLACHRIEQLHSMIHQKEQLENVASQLGEDDVELNGSANLIAEARLLVGFAVQTAISCSKERGASNIDSTSGADWNVLARALSLWAPYSEAKHIDAFLSWVLSSLILPNDDSGLNKALQRDRDIARALVADASFYENTEISSQLFGAIITAAITAAKEATAPSSEGGATTRSAQKKNNRKRSRSFDSSGAYRTEGLLCVPSDTTSFQHLTVKSLAEAYKNVVGNDSSLRSTPSNCFAKGGGLDKALHLLRFADELPRDLVVRTCKPLHLDLLLRLDAYAQDLLCSSSGLLQQQICFASACKLALERVLVATSFPFTVDSHGSLCSSESQKVFLEATHRSCLRVSKLGYESLSDYSLRSGRVVELLLSNALLTYRNDSSLLETFADATDRVLSLEDGSGKAGAGFIAKILFLRSIARGLISADSGVLRSRDTTNEKRALDLFFPLAFFKGGFWKMLIDFIVVDKAGAYEEQAEILALQEAVLLVGDLVLYASSLPSKVSGPIEPFLQIATESVFRSVSDKAFSDNVDGNAPGSLRSSLYYLVASAPKLCCNLTSLDAPKVTLEMMKKHFKTSPGDPDSLLDAAFCGIVQHINAEQTCSLLAALINGLQNTAWETRYLDIASSVHAYHLILLSAKGQQQKSEVASVARYLSSVSQQLLCSAPRRLIERPARIGTKFLTTLIGKKDIILFSSQDAAALLASIITLLPPIPKGTLHEAKTDGNLTSSSDIYSECCAIVSALIKFYPKQLYGCTPSVISVLHSLLSHATVATGENAALMGIEFGKIAELLSAHSEVFKKHVLGLILFFVDSLVAGMSAATKRNLLPAIFSLLGLLSKHELHQLQVTMTPSSKSIFRSVFRDFQRLQYKGQY